MGQWTVMVQHVKGTPSCSPGQINGPVDADESAYGGHTITFARTDPWAMDTDESTYKGHIITSTRTDPWVSGR